MDFKYREILLSDQQLGPYPLEKLPRVETATTHHTAETQRRSLGRHTVFVCPPRRIGACRKGRHRNVFLAANRCLPL